VDTPAVDAREEPPSPHAKRKDRATSPLRDDGGDLATAEAIAQSASATRDLLLDAAPGRCAPQAGLIRA